MFDLSISLVCVWQTPGKAFWEKNSKIIHASAMCKQQTSSHYFDLDHGRKAHWSAYCDWSWAGLGPSISVTHAQVMASHANIGFVGLPCVVFFLYPGADGRDSMRQASKSHLWMAPMCSYYVRLDHTVYAHTFGTRLGASSSSPYLVRDLIVDTEIATWRRLIWGLPQVVLQVDAAIRDVHVAFLQMWKATL